VTDGADANVTYVGSTNGVRVAVFDLGPPNAAPTLLISHATGFHGHCYVPLAEELGTRAHCVGFDYRGHGDTVLPPGIGVDWDTYTDDVIAVAQSLGRPILAFGHSMGGACLLTAAHRHPDLFRQLIVYEPIVPPPGALPVGEQALDDNPLAAGALRRRADFESFDAALANYSAKRPLNGWRPDALRAYVEHGFRPTDDGVTLKCTPQVEAATFATASIDTWGLLPQITTPVTVLAGRLDGTPPPAFAEPVAQRLANATFQRLDELDHFGPMTHPDVLAAQISAALP